MKSKSLKDKEDKSRVSDFLHLYEKGDETIVKLKAHEGLNDSSKFTKKSNKQRVKSPNKESFKHNIANCDNKQKATSTSELVNNDTNKKVNAVTKPIIRNTGTTSDLSTSKPKKRNKSVSFVLDENEEVKVKKTKSEYSVKDNRLKMNAKKAASENIQKKEFKKKPKTSNTAEKENTKTCEELPNVEGDKNILKDSIQVSGKSQENISSESNKILKKMKSKNVRKFQKEHKLMEQDNAKHNAQTLPEIKIEPNEVQEKKSKQKKNKHLLKTVGDMDAKEGEPAIKSQRKDEQPEAVLEDLENLSIGDNTHTLTNLLDEMVVVDKKKLKKRKHKQKKDNQSVITSTDTKLEGSKLKEKWRKKRWNKDRKPVVSSKHIASSVNVDNLPHGIILNYKKLLAEHFSNCGAINKIGIAEIYLTDDPKQVFSTTILFDNEEAALKALQEDNTLFEGNLIRIKQSLPPSKTTLVVHSYGQMTENALSSIFNSAGRIRNIWITKRKKSMGTAFIEFDGPTALDRAVQIAEDNKIGGKNIYISKFDSGRKLKNKRQENSAVTKNDESSDSSDE